MDRNKREVSFELGKEIEKDGFLSDAHPAYC